MLMLGQRLGEARQSQQGEEWIPKKAGVRAYSAVGGWVSPLEAV